LQVRSVKTLAPVWTSELFPAAYLETQDEVRVGDVDNDGVDDVVLLASLTVRVFSTGIARAAPVTPARFDASAAIHADTHVGSACCATVHLHWDEAAPGDSAPLQYRLYRGSRNGGPLALLATTAQNEFADVLAGGVAGYRYLVEVVDAGGNVAPAKLQTDVAIGGSGRCRRPSGKP
jgi:hypothetical protein